MAVWERDTLPGADRTRLSNNGLDEIVAVLKNLKVDDTVVQEDEIVLGAGSEDFRMRKMNSGGISWGFVAVEGELGTGIKLELLVVLEHTNTELGALDVAHDRDLLTGDLEGLLDLCIELLVVFWATVREVDSDEANTLLDHFSDLFRCTKAGTASARHDSAIKSALVRASTTHLMSGMEFGCTLNLLISLFYHIIK